jgi:hypothetical protein
MKHRKFVCEIGVCHPFFNVIKFCMAPFTSHADSLAPGETIRIGSLDFAVGNGGELELILIFMSSQAIHFRSLDFVADNFSPPAAP